MAGTAKRGAAAAGHPQTTETATVLLAEGGNAVDAALGAMLTACVAEPVLASLGGGGYLLARPPGGAAPRLYDFFIQTPLTPIPAADADFREVVADFGTATQAFHVGFAAMAVPGVVRGLFDAHRDLGHMPLAEVAAPALALAREGVRVNRFQGYLLTVVEAILRQTPACEALFCAPPTPGITSPLLLQEGQHFRNPALADTLEVLIHEGPALFYRGEIAAALAEASASTGGHLRREDLEGYRCVVRTPLRLDYGSATLFTNPPPSLGGSLIAFALDLLEGRGLGAMGWGGRDHLGLLAAAQAVTGAARREAEGQDDPEHLARPEVRARWRAALDHHVGRRPVMSRGTTHISVIDAKGMAVALTLSNGEGSGWVIPGTGIQMNNMLGEEDLCPEGWQCWPRGERLASMMAPTLVIHRDGAETALGSGGSNRIRSAILQVLVNLLEFGLPLEEAITRPRLHVEGDALAAERELPETLRAAWPRYQVWPELNMFFGGVHAVHRHASGAVEAVGDPRRDGAGKVH